MSEAYSRKCRYYNSGYCKFTRKENGCCNLHPTETCKIPKSREKGCPLRHPKNVDMVMRADTTQNACTLTIMIPLKWEAIPRILTIKQNILEEEIKVLKAKVSKLKAKKCV